MQQTIINHHKISCIFYINLQIPKPTDSIIRNPFNTSLHRFTKQIKIKYGGQASTLNQIQSCGNQYNFCFASQKKSKPLKSIKGKKITQNEAIKANNDGDGDDD